MGKNIAIDGPAGAGKSTIAKQVAKELGFIYVDTGAMYRAIALYLLRNEISADEPEEIEKNCNQITVSIRYENEIQQVILNDENVTELLREEKVGKFASACSIHACVREKLLSLQRELASKENVIMDGRDIGTCVLPNADLKIYLTASVETRANRRFLELQEKGVACDMEEIKADIKMRDERDMNRSIAPLVQAEDAVLVDSSNMNIEQVVEEIKMLYKEKTEA